jgi:predicted AlkP superfamily phosphohydrolase/phosphomutase
METQTLAACKRVMIIGLDCAAPELVFEQFAGQLPTMDAFRKTAQWGQLESVVPPITVPAWACMMSGKDPGRLGIYGFRNRASHEYGDLKTANSESVREPLLWDILGTVGMRSILMGVPPSFPVKPVRGIRIGCFLTPNTKGDDWVSPPAIAAELNTAIGGYSVDVEDFRSEDKDRLLRDIFELSRTQFSAAEYLLEKKPWEFFMMVNIAVDRMHHAFWGSFDPQHRKYVPGNKHESAMLAFYQEVDERIARLLRFADANTAVLIVSDHGAKRIDGGICINEWLIREGLLTLQGPLPNSPTPYAKVGVDWSRTKVWGEGGYYARIFINKQGREPNGQVSAEDYESFRDELAQKLRAIPDDQGRPMKNLVYKPEDAYPDIRGIAPDLLVHFGDLHWRSIGTVGHGSTHTFENDTGPDDANHAQHGLYMLRAPGFPTGRKDGKLLQIAPTILKILGRRIPADMREPALG